MVWLIINIISIGAYSLIYWLVDNKKVRLGLLILTITQIVFIMGFRHETMGTDLSSYSAKFKDLCDLPFTYLFNKSFYSVTYSNMETGFIFFTKIVTLFTKDFRVYIFIVALVTFVPTFFVFAKISKNPILSIFIFIALQFMNFYASGLRQAIGMTLCLLALFCYLKNKKVLTFILIVLGFLFHKSSVVFLLVYFCDMKWTKKKYLIFLIIYALVFLFRRQIYRLCAPIFGYGDSMYSLEETHSYGMLFLDLIVSMVGYVAIGENKNNRLFSVLFTFICISNLFMIFVLVGHNSLRAAFYFFVCSSVFIPNLVTKLKKSDLVIFTSALVFVGVIYYITNTMKLYDFSGFRFWWQ